MKESNQYDVIVVGTGPGGATVAREMARLQKKVLMLEWGNFTTINGSIPQAIQNVGTPFKHVLFTYNMLGMVRAVTTGGSSVYYYATAFDPPFDMLKQYGIDISKEIDEVKQEIPIAPLRDDLIGPLAKRIMHSANDLGYNWKKLNKFVYQGKCRPNCDKCNYGCPYGAKWNARYFVQDALAYGATLKTHAKVTQVLIEGQTAVGVEYLKNCVKQKAFAPIVVIAAGGIGSPVILRQSGFQNAGYDYFFDPLIITMGEVKDIKGGKEFPMTAGIHIEDEGYMMTDMTIPNLLYQAFSAETFRFDRLFAHPGTLTIMIKEKDKLGGRLTNCGGVRKKLSPSDYSSLHLGHERAKKILKNAGAKHIFKSWYVAAHPGGTVKINDIVNSDLQTHISNLYVCDCSVIPESFGMPPTLTLIGLGKRLARHLNQA